MRHAPIKSFVFGMFVSCAALLATNDARSEPQGATGASGGGFGAVYGTVSPDQVEFMSSPDRIKSIAANGAPMAIWEALEHGERVECLDCISAVEPLLYDQNPRTREISAWWLRRRIIGVFGPGEAYERTLNTLKGDASPQRRAYAAYALGEFLFAPGVAACATAVTTDGDATVRAAAASALGRLNDEGGGALGKALTDQDGRVKLAALASAGRINSFTGVANVAALTGDADANVRRRTLEILDSMHGRDSIASVIALAKTDADANVRLAACHALGSFGDASAKPTLQAIADTDASTLVRDQAAIALLRL